MKLTLTRARRSGGFTLVEMAIVLVIIGLIIAAVSIGKDAERNAEYKKISQKFVGQWRQAYNEYYGRYHAPVGDNVQQPTQAVGGGAGGTCWANPNGGVYRCHFGGAPLVQLMTQAGIKLPQGQGGSGDLNNGTATTPAQYVYLDQAGTPHTLTVSFEFQTVSQNSYAAASHINPPVGNLMRLDNVVPELASTLDNMYDGVADPNQGNFQCGPVTQTNANNPQSFLGGSNAPLGDPAATANASDEQASTNWTCVWKMTN